MLSIITNVNNYLWCDVYINFYNLFDYVIAKETLDNKIIQNLACISQEEAFITVPVSIFVPIF